MEMTIEEKAKAYDIAVKKLTTLFGSGDTCTREEIEHVFPELAESKDEKMRKKCIELIKELKTFCMRDGQEECIAWLEKQGEQKLEPKFEIGDTIRNKKNGETFTIVVRSILTQYYSNEDHTIEINFSDQDGWELVKPISAEWSEEDEKVTKWVIDYIGNCPNESFDFYGGVGKEAVLSWLNKLKDILQSKPKQDSTDRFFEGFKKGEQSVIENYGKYGLCKLTEWSEEDEYHKRQILRILKDNRCSQALQEKTEKWIEERLKSLRPQSTWKPSEKEMEALKVAIEHCDKAHFVNTNPLLVALYEDLNKLIE